MMTMSGSEAMNATIRLEVKGVTLELTLDEVRELRRLLERVVPTLPVVDPLPLPYTPWPAQPSMPNDHLPDWYVQPTTASKSIKIRTGNTSSSSSISLIPDMRLGEAYAFWDNEIDAEYDGGDGE